MKWVARLGTASVAALIASPSFAAIRDDIGWSQLNAELGGSMPTGSGVTVSQVEANQGGVNYYPGTFGVKTINNVSNFSSGTSTHAQTVGERLYGTGGIAPGVATIDSYSADGQTGSASTTGWLFEKGLRVGTDSDPLVESRNVQVHAWVGTFETAAENTDALLRHDYQIRHDNFIAVVAINNTGGDKTYEPLLANGMNSISVGRTDGIHSQKPSGNVRPLLVAPDTETSYATGTVAGAAALLIDAAGGSTTNAGRNDSIKAIMLAGATKSEFTSWMRTDTTPLDRVVGAGEVNVYNSYKIIAAGEHDASASQLVTTRGYDVNTANSIASNLYYFDIGAGQTATTFSAALAWNTSATASGFTLDDLNLRLYSASGFTVGSMLQQSIATGGGTYTDFDSDVWNVEHLWLTNLAPGRYALEVSDDTLAGNWSYALAWDAQLTPEPSVGLFALLVFPLMRRRRSK